MIQDTLRRVQYHKQSVLTVSYWGPDSYEVTSRAGYLCLVLLCIQNDFGPSKLFWSSTNHFGQIQCVLVGSKYFGQVKIIKISPEKF